MRLYPDSKVYVVCPANYHTGGAELLHQLCSQLIAFGVKAYMHYFKRDRFDLKVDPVDSFYKKYHLPYVTSIEDIERNIFVAYEGPTEFLYIPKKCQRVLWWLSADNFVGCLARHLQAYVKYNLVTSKPLPKVFSFQVPQEVDHLAQSEHARKFLLLNGIPDYKIYMVEDYLNHAFLSRAAQVDLSLKENFVAYNPKKGFETTKQLIELAPDIDWRPIQNMTPEQVQELLALAKVYIDFGNHPGKDRIPREAAISGCVVITGRRGSAGNDIDINIPNEFKFDDINLNPQQVIEKIRKVFDNFDAFHEKQADYRARILDDKNRFDKEVEELFTTETQPPLSVALTQGVGEESFLLAEQFFQEFSRSGLIKPSFIVDDILAATKISNELLLREQNRNYLRVGENLIEIITRDDAKFLYREDRIKKFALLEPKEAQLDELKNFYGASDDDILTFAL